jgi:Holliday junction DNA helicase RuvA
MIAFLHGQILAKKENYLILNVNNVGYKVFVPLIWLNQLNLSDDLDLYIHQHVREDCLDLYGFKTLADMELFTLLLSVSGVGPKSALSVMAIAKTGDIKSSIVRGDSSLLIKVSGIGKKIAERVVLELKNKVDLLAGEDGDHSNYRGDEIDALLALGYTLPQAREALNLVDRNLQNGAERIRAALRLLGK